LYDWHRNRQLQNAAPANKEVTASEYDSFNYAWEKFMKLHRQHGENRYQQAVDLLKNLKHIEPKKAIDITMDTIRGRTAYDYDKYIKDLGLTMPPSNFNWKSGLGTAAATAATIAGTKYLGSKLYNYYKNKQRENATPYSENLNNQ
jgi:hypothetical protein